MTKCLTIPRTLAVFALGLFALPMLPALAHAQTKETQEGSVELQIQTRHVESDKNTEAELERAKAELARLQAQIKATQDRIKALEKRLAATKGGKGAANPKEGIIVLWVDDGQQKEQTEIHLRKVGDKWEIVPPPGKQLRAEGLTFEMEFKGDNLLLVPAKPEKKPAAKPGQDARLESLERQLKEIMKQLEEIRKESKQPGKTGAAPKTDEEQLRFLLESLELQLVPGEPEAKKK